MLISPYVFCLQILTISAIVTPVSSPHTFCDGYNAVWSDSRQTRLNVVTIIICGRDQRDQCDQPLGLSEIMGG